MFYKIKNESIWDFCGQTLELVHTFCGVQAGGNFQTIAAWMNNCRHERCGKREWMGRVAFNMNISLWNKEGTGGGGAATGVFS